MDRRARIGARVRAARQQARLTQKELGALVGLSHGGVSEIERGKVGISAESLRRFAQALNKPPSWFYGEEGEATESVREALARIRRELERLGPVSEQPIAVEYPVVGRVPAGYPSLQEQEVVRYVRIPAGAFWLEVEGDSLAGLGIENGDTLVVDPGNREPRRGQPAVVRLLATNEVTVKRWFPENDHVRLEPANHRYRSIRATDVEVLGVVVHSMKHF